MNFLSEEEKKNAEELRRRYHESDEVDNVMIKILAFAIAVVLLIVILIK